MLVRMTRASRSVWEKRVERWRNSGQSAEEFAASMGFNVWTLRKWSERLRRERAAGPDVQLDKGAQQPKGTGTRRPAAPAGAVRPLAFVEVLPGGPAAAGAPSPAFEIVLRSGVTVRVPARFEPQALAQVLAAVENR